MTDTHLNEIAAIIRRVKAEAYEQGKADAKREMLTYLTTDATMQPPAEAQPKGADATTPVTESPPRSSNVAARKSPVPRGTPEKLIRRALSSRAGLTANEILEQAANKFERQIHPQSLRNELIRGRRAGRYRDVDNRWYLVDAAGKDEAEGNAHKHPPSASNLNQGERHAPALAE